ncbi:MAG: hypothetical protein AAF492_33345, partial [Verrucomicrobiota bacterium]
MCSHIVLDMFCDDRREPIGVMLFWPINEIRFSAPSPVFPPLYKTRWSDILIWENFYAVFVEIAVVMPILLGVLWVKSRMRQPEPERVESRLREGAP